MADIARILGDYIMKAKREYLIRVFRQNGSNFLDKFLCKQDALEMIGAINQRHKETGLKARLEGPVK
jgi:hypothetical protein